MTNKTLQQKLYFLKSIKSGGMPNHLHKYRGFDKYTDKIFSNSELWFSNPLEFNDPFDCQLNTNADYTVEELKVFLNKIYPGTRKSKRVVINRFKQNPDYLRGLIDDTIRNFSSNAGICSFTTNYKSILMWSHYANSHNGICIKFDLTKDPMFFLVPIKVIYPKDDKYPTYNHLRQEDSILEFMFQTKSKQWAYENEYRIIQQSSGAYKFNKSCLVEVIFGCRVTESRKREYMQFIRDCGFLETEFFQMNVSTSAFALNKSPIRLKNER